MPNTKYIYRIQYFLKQYETVVFWSVCVVLSVLQHYFGLQHFYFDAERYWECGRELKVDGVFSLANHVTPRGVLFPLFNYGLIELLGYLGWHEITVFKCLNALFTTWGFWYVLPALFHKISGQIPEVTHKLALTAIANFFWFRYFSCPLSDFLCLFLALYGFELLWSANITVWRMLVVGLICGFVLNTRPIYSLLIVGYPLFLWVVSNHRSVYKLAYAAIIIMAVLCINLPQRKVNQQVWQSDSFFQPTDKYYNGRSLYLIQLKWGLYIQKYDTYVGNAACYKSAQVFYLHHRNNSLTLNRHKIDAIETYGQYIQYVMANPISVVWYAKNLFNGLDIQYNSVYLFSLKTNRLFSLLNYLLWFCGIGLFWLTRNQWFHSRAGNIVFVFLMITTILSIPTAIEVRFLLPLYLMMYVLVVTRFGLWVQYIKSLSMRQIVVGSLILIAFVLGCFYLSHTTYQQLEFVANC